MRIVPVIDLLGGHVVHAVAGRRREYRPIDSDLAGSAQPAAIAGAFVERFGFQTAYVADLDAIAGAEPAWSAYQEIAACGLQLWIDAGVGTPRRAEQFAEHGSAHQFLDRVVLGSESIAGLGALRELLNIIDRQRVIFSLDLLCGKLLGAAWADYTPVEAARGAIEAGIQQMIVLDLGHVGTNRGICSTVSELRPLALERHLRLIAGGGVRSIVDLEFLAAMDVEAVLVASALHNGQLTGDDLRKFQTQCAIVR
ncbi:MAG TPA: HisA/HisF-related TIM barrel protein [Pirellulales bacterium]|nr:HisA/HisF-related TIM barrel protein [Pirellulales bacterium]